MNKFVHYVETRQLAEAAALLAQTGLDADMVCRHVHETVRLLARRDALTPDALYTVLEFGSDFGQKVNNWQTPTPDAPSPVAPAGQQTWWNKVRTLGANVGGFVNNLVRAGQGEQPQELSHSRVQALGGAALKSLTNLRNNLMGDPAVAAMLAARPAGVSVQPSMSFADVLGVVQKALQDTLHHHHQHVQTSRRSHWK
jgi:hypothetical protein